MELETLQKGIELNNRREALEKDIHELKDAIDYFRQHGGYIDVKRPTNGVLVRIKGHEPILKLMGHELKILLHQLSQVELEILNLDEPVQKTPTQAAE